MGFDDSIRDILMTNVFEKYMREADKVEHFSETVETKSSRAFSAVFAEPAVRPSGKRQWSS